MKRLLLIAALAAAGCHSGQPPAGPPVAPAQPTAGTVTLAGTPLVGGIVTFSPVEVEAGSQIRYEAAGLVDAKGRFKIGLNGDGKGVPAGDYKVTVKPRDYQELRGSNSARIPPRYRAKATTPLTLSVKEDDNNFRIEIR